ncbi:uncharacterized protein LTR77_009151 [Saxophila tyrrhenica]|uniref:CENP-V/GFA domain-containing protein n=1 Tax=Saxophila tyrrhenica TaxID=1690608 RepID=A0AAV9NYE8_9PEZI|nr:hypothetical protein LTR77_009151 [Saxophila tyrrhenica]
MPNLTGDPADHTTESLNDGMTGSCLCGAIKVTVTQQDLFTKPSGHTCHCKNCRQFTGSAFATVLMVPKENVELSDPKRYLKSYTDNDTASGDALRRSFCSNCGSSVGEFVDEESDEKNVFLNTGIFPRIPTPAFELFTKHRHGWVEQVQGAAQHDFLRKPFKT